MDNTNKRLIIIAGIIFSLLLFASAYVLFKEEIPRSGSSNDLNPQDAFVFFGVGPKTIISRGLRDELRDTLGSDAIETRTPVNLEILYPGFIKEHFPQIHRLHRQLNENIRQRIEHITIKIMFRYIPDKIKSFNYVEFLFSNYSQNPLYVKIRGKNDGTEILELLKTRYGEPSKIHWGKTEEWSFYWENHGDILTFSNKPDKFGNPDYLIMAYFIENIKELIEKEAHEKQLREDEAKRQLEKAF